MLPAFWAGGEGVILHTLLDLKLIRAAFTLVLVDWHYSFPPGGRMLKKSVSVVLASFRPSTYPRGYAFGPSLAAALLNGLFEHPAGFYYIIMDN
jgi:hypothetical protein